MLSFATIASDHANREALRRGTARGSQTNDDVVVVHDDRARDLVVEGLVAPVECCPREADEEERRDAVTDRSHERSHEPRVVALAVDHAHAEQLLARRTAGEPPEDGAVPDEDDR